MTFDFDALLAPLGATAFFSTHYEKNHLHLSAGAEARANLLSWEEFLQGILTNPKEHSGILCFPEQIQVSREDVLSDESTLRRYLDAGHPIVWNRARALSPRITEVCERLANTFGAHVWPNVYATGEAGTPFEMHFDAHEVIAIHCEGQKTWDISKLRVNRPIEASEMAASIQWEIRARSSEAAENVLDTFTVSPGDLVYIPRGQFHNARTNSGRSLHVTFGIEMPTGYDLAKRIWQSLLADPQMREYPLPKYLDPNGANTKNWLAEIAARVGRASSAETLAAEHDKLTDIWIRKSSRKLE